MPKVPLDLPKTNSNQAKRRRARKMFTSAAVFGCFLIAAGAVQAQTLIRQSGIASEHALSQETIQRLKSSVTTELKSAENSLGVISQTDGIAELSAEECQEELTSIYSQLDTIFLNISRMNSSGVIDCNTYLRGVGTTAEELPHLREILQDPEHNPVLGSVTESIQSDASLFVSMHVPIFDEDDEFRGSVGSSLRLDDLNTELSNEFDASTRGTVALIDDNGDIIYHSRSPVAGRNIENGAIFTEAETTSLQEITNFDLSDEIDQFEVEGADTTITYGVADVFENRNWFVVEVLSDEEAVNLAFSDTYLLRWVTLPTLIVFAMFAVLSTGVLFGARAVWRRL